MDFGLLVWRKPQSVQISEIEILRRPYILIFVDGILMSLKLTVLARLLQISRKKTHSNQNRIAIEAEVDQEKEEERNPTLARFV